MIKSFAEHVFIYISFVYSLKNKKKTKSRFLSSPFVQNVL